MRDNKIEKKLRKIGRENKERKRGREKERNKKDRLKKLGISPLTCKATKNLGA